MDNFLTWLNELDVVTPLIFTLVGGIIGGLVSPLVHWFIEKRRSVMQYRQQLIKTWREEISNFNEDKGEILNTASYSALRGQLSIEMINKLEPSIKGGILITAKPQGDGRFPTKKNILLDEIAKIEKKWKLV